MPRSGDTDPPARAPTASGAPTVEHNALCIEELQRELHRLKRAHAKLADADERRRELLIELAGRDGEGGVIAAIRAEQLRSSTSQGKRIGALEIELRSEAKTSTYTRAQLGVLAVLGLALLGAALKYLLST